jgi:hypothetical protein
VSPTFAGIGAQKQGALQAEGLDIEAQGTDISASSTQITAEGLRTQAAGNIAEATEYNEAAGLAEENEAFTAQSARIQQRQETETLGGQRAAVAGAGFSEGGSAFYLMQDSANQGALANGVIGAQAAITKAGSGRNQHGRRDRYDRHRTIGHRQPATATCDLYPERGEQSGDG